MPFFEVPLGILERVLGAILTSVEVVRRSALPLEGSSETTQTVRRDPLSN